MLLIDAAKNIDSAHVDSRTTDTDQHHRDVESESTARRREKQRSGDGGEHQDGDGAAGTHVIQGIAHRQLHDDEAADPEGLQIAQVLGIEHEFGPQFGRDYRQKRAEKLAQDISGEESQEGRHAMVIAGGAPSCKLENYCWAWAICKAVGATCFMARTRDFNSLNCVSSLPESVFPPLMFTLLGLTGRLLARIS